MPSDLLAKCDIFNNNAGSLAQAYRFETLIRLIWPKLDKNKCNQDEIKDVRSRFYKIINEKPDVFTGNELKDHRYGMLF